MTKFSGVPAYNPYSEISLRTTGSQPPFGVGIALFTPLQSDIRFLRFFYPLGIPLPLRFAYSRERESIGFTMLRFNDRYAW